MWRRGCVRRLSLRVHGGNRRLLRHIKFEGKLLGLALRRQDRRRLACARNAAVDQRP
jgi:hypothetical protein